MAVLDLLKNQKYVLACSFGPDSMALFDMALKEKFNFVVAHVNYHKRDISNFEEQEMKRACAEHNIVCHVLDTSSLVVQGNFQDWARRIRYEFFQKVAKIEKADAILVAHHMDDLLETYLMQQMRHNYVDYYGLKKETEISGVKVIRPLLRYTKKQLREYCELNAVPFSLDVSNDSDVYLRNKIRHQQISKMDLDAKIKLVNEIESKNQDIARQKEKLKEFIKKDTIFVEDFLSLNQNEQTILMDLFLKSQKVNYHFSASHLKELVKALKQNKPNVFISVSKAHRLIREYDLLKICEKIVEGDYKYIMSEPSRLETPYFTIDLSKDLQRFHITKEDFPLTIRPVKCGDLSYINNIKKKVSRLYIDWKMPQELRSIWPLIFNKQDKLVYVHRYYGRFSVNDNKDFVVKY